MIDVRYKLHTETGGTKAWDDEYSKNSNNLNKIALCVYIMYHTAMLYKSYTKLKKYTNKLQLKNMPA